MRIYDRFLNLLHEVDSFQSLQFTRNFHGVGSFEIHINRYMSGAEHFLKGNLISLGEPHKVGFIVSREITLDEKGKETENVKVEGKTLCGLMNRRITVPPEHTSHDRKQGNAETVMKHYVYNHFFSPVDRDRKLPSLEIEPNQNRGEHIEWESRFKNVADELEEISLLTNLGWEIVADFSNKKFIFQCYESKDLTQTNPHGNSPVFFSPEFENVKGMQFVDSDVDLRNYGYVGGQGEGVERRVVQLGDTEGWNRIETFVDARDVGTEDEETDEELTDEEIEKLLTKRGKEKMREMETILSLEAEIITPITRTTYEITHDGYRHPGQPNSSLKPKKQVITPFQYERDFDLGDRVDIVNKSWNLTMSTPIIEITEIHEVGGFKLEAIFGENRPTLITKLNHKFSELEDVDKQESPYIILSDANEYTDKKINEIESGFNVLWEGSMYPSESQTITPTKRLTECTTGWILKWQAYSPGSGTTNSNFDYSTQIPKSHAIYNNGQSIRAVLGITAGETIDKFFYVYDNRIVGHSYNGESDRRDRALTAIIEY